MNQITPEKLAAMIDHSLLPPSLTLDAVRDGCRLAARLKTASVCVRPADVALAAEILSGSDVAVGTVIGFPHGTTSTPAKTAETRQAVCDGADELDMVLNVGAMKSGNLKLVEDDIRTVRRATRQKTVLKVIIETALLTEDEKVLACQISKRAGADFVKTCTGFAGGGATPEDIALMRRTVGPDMGVKASGGMRNYPAAMGVIAAGANRIGAVSSIAIVTGQQGKGSY